MSANEWYQKRELRKTIPACPHIAYLNLDILFPASFEFPLHYGGWGEWITKEIQIRNFLYPDWFQAIGFPIQCPYKDVPPSNQEVDFGFQNRKFPRDCSWHSYTQGSFPHFQGTVPLLQAASQEGLRPKGPLSPP